MTKAVEYHRPVLMAEVSPAEVDAGAGLALKVRAVCPQGCDLSGAAIAIRDANGNQRAVGHLAPLDGQDGFATDDIVLQAPPDVGAYRYTTVLGANESDSIAHEASAETTFVVTAHAAYIHSWDVPSAIAAGERFGFRFGIKCSCGCNLGGRGFRILDQDGAEVAAGALRVETWPGTAALYFAEMEATAPAATGDYAWTIESPGAGSGLPHQAGAARVGLKVVPAPDHEVTVVVVDRASRAPVNGISVLMHPYRALTDENGIARIGVAKGTYRLHVSGRKYLPCQDLIDASGNLTVRVELAAEVPHSPFFPMPVKQEPSVAEVIT